MHHLLEYACEKLGAGVQKLATHPGRINERLIEAFHDALHAVPTEAVPDEPRIIWDKVWAKATAVKGSEKTGSIVPSSDALDERTAVELAEMITTVDSMAESAFLAERQ